MANSAENRFGLTNDCITRAWRRIPLRCHAYLARPFWRRDALPRLQSLENATSIATTAHILIYRHKSYLGFVPGIEMQPSACQCFARTIEKEEMKCRIIDRIALTTVSLIPWLAQKSPAKIKIS